MSFNSETASAIKHRFGFYDYSSQPIPSIRSSPDLLKSASKESLLQSSAIRSIGERDDYGAGTANHSFEFREDPSFWKDHNVQVIIRIRPLSSSELSQQGHNKCVRQDSCQSITWIGHPESRFTFDLVADENVSQEMLFKVAGVPMVENCMGGYNSCMFAYGQTGSGKTHTMLGDIEEGTRRHSVNCGMTPRVFEYLFSRIQKEKEARREEKLGFTCKCSFLEIYNEQILDLLDPSSTNLQIREDLKKGVYVENLTEVEAKSARDVIQQLIQGSANRKVAATNMNRASSRSHSVFTCIIESKWESQGVTHHRFAQLNLVDLAGSERQKSSGAEGERLKEATNINKSLSTLGLVIMNLVNISNGKSLHVPYRDSKLTFLLQDSLGGNSKTIIIANISPSTCCSLETLSTLKFAQRAKFIKNHAIVNEDASGDVIAMRMQIQQLKKEVSRLRSIVNNEGAENHDIDALTVSFPGSPGSFKWEGLKGSFSPLTSNKRMSRKKDYEAALVGAFRREKDKDIALRALAAENQAAMQLAKQREAEIQGLKMRLRFREAGIKRLEAVAAGKISAEMHFLKEKEEHLKEIEMLRTQADRNQEVTRFAMENLRLKEEIRRLKSFCEEGEWERMNEQIMILQNKLLEALDWKLMHESDPSFVQKGNSDLAMDIRSDSSLLTSSQEPASPMRTSINEENEFLRMQAIRNQSELDAFRKKLDFCISEKDDLERHVNDLIKELEAEKSSKATLGEKTVKSQNDLTSLATEHMSNIALTDQMELKTMVDAIAAASQREAEAHEMAIMLSKENDELKMKLKVLIEDNNRLIELYERVVAENKDSDKAQNSQKKCIEDHSNHLSEFVEKEVKLKKDLETLEYQLREMHEENEKLMALYEQAMQERDAFKRMLSSDEGNRLENKGEFSCAEKLVEIDGGECLKFDEPVSGNKKIMGEENDLSGAYKVNKQECLFGLDKSPCCLQAENVVTCGLLRQDALDDTESDMCHRTGSFKIERLVTGESDMSMVKTLCSGINVDDRASLYPKDCDAVTEALVDGNDSGIEVKSSSVTTVKLPEDLNLMRIKLNKVQEDLLKSAQTVGVFGSLERAMIEVDKLSREIEALEDGAQVKQDEYASSKLLLSEMQERRVLSHKKIMALKYSISSFSSSLAYFEQREAQAKARVNVSLSYLNQKKEELAHLQSSRDEIEGARMKIQQSKEQLKKNLAELKSKIEEQNKRQENERVLFAIDNVEKTDICATQRNWHLTGKATELLVSEEQKTKLQTEMKQGQEKLGVMRKEVEDLNKKSKKVESVMQNVQKEIETSLKATEEMNLRLQSVIQEKEMVLEMKESGRTEFENMVIEYHQHLFEAELKDIEIQILEAELQRELRKVEELQTAKTEASKRMTQLLEVMKCPSCLVSDKIEEELHNIRMSVMELKSLIGVDSSSGS